jgi:hypothetical protein
MNLIRCFEWEISMTDEERGLFGELARHEAVDRDAGLARYREVKKQKRSRNQ